MPARKSGGTQWAWTSYVVIVETSHVWLWCGPVTVAIRQ
jgi:hypothetical protein